MKELLIIDVKNVDFNGTEAYLMCTARFGAIPSAERHDYSTNITNGPLIIHLPEVGSWFISFYLVGSSKKQSGVREEILNSTSFSVDFTAVRYILINLVQPKFYPFPLDPLFNNDNSGWTYLNIDIPNASSGKKLHVKLQSGGSKLNYEIYIRYGGIASPERVNFFYKNPRSYTNDSIYFKLYEATEEVVSFFLLYVRVGEWSIAIRRVDQVGIVLKNRTMAWIDIEECPEDCASHGHCLSSYDLTGSFPWSYCLCDDDHGGFDCGFTFVSPGILESISLIFSSCLALLPACLSIYRQSYAEWIVFVSSATWGVLHHSCDIGLGCSLPSDFLQFMDFWVFLLAAVTTFMHLFHLGEAWKRTIQISAAFLTGILARNGATISSHVMIALAFGMLGPLLGLLGKLAVTCATHFIFAIPTCVDIANWWHTFSGRLRDQIIGFFHGLHPQFVVPAFIFLCLAIQCWNNAASGTYWIWHSLWHLCSYISAFFFLCTRAAHVDVAPPQQQIEMAG